MQPGVQKSRKQRLGPFQIEEILAESNATRVMRARYLPETIDASLKLTLDQQVILKLLRGSAPQLQNGSATAREADFLSRIQCPLVPRFVTRGVTSGREWFVSEFVEGVDLAAIMSIAAREDRRLKADLAISLVLNVLEALSAVHSAVDDRGRPLGLIHRDTTPTNVIVDRQGRAHLIDLGHAFSSILEEPGTSAIGTPGYMSPEQARADQLTQATDVYTSGVLLFELLTGNRAFGVDLATDNAVLKAHADNQHAPWPRNHNIRPELCALVDRALGDAAEDRPHNAAVMHTILRSELPDPSRAQGLIARIVAELSPR